jgi:spore germination cell wall hydrolase CwlJ-like protein
LRIRLLFTLALFLGVGTTPLHASLGIAPQCAETPTARSELRVTELAQLVTSYDAEDRDYMIRTIAFEAGDESDEGKTAVAYVIVNRMKTGAWGDSIKDVVTRPWQFEPWMTRREEMEKLSLDDPRYQHAAQIADAVLIGQMPDPTAGATYFLNPTLVRERRGGSLPEWAQGDGQAIGRHTFYMPDESAAPHRQSLPASGDALSCPHLEAGEAAHHFG